jgi:lambda family phage tail tape measure protein
MGGSSNAIVKAIGGGLESYKAADGAAFSGGNVIPFASGGVVGSPTYFGMGGGQTGLMGEAGPEAIMPLKRGPDGKLGVATTSNSQSVTVVQNINVSTGVQQTVRAEVMGLMPQIAAASKAAVLDAKRRGGSFGGSFR